MAGSPRYGRRGFSLLEVMIALAIFSVALLALVPLFATASWGTRGSRDLTTATALARTYVDKLRNTPFNQLGPCDPAGCTPPTAPIDEVAKNRPFVVTWTVTAVDGTAYPFASPPAPNMKRITVTVTRACDCAGGARRVQMSTLVSERS